MLKNLIILIVFVGCNISIFGQEKMNIEEQIIVQKVKDFFDGFHAKDSLLIKRVTHQNLIMQSIGKNKTSGQIELSKQNFNEFLKTIASIPAHTKIEEHIHEFRVIMDGKMANVWTPYTFYIDDVISHCGTNSFQLFKRKGTWKIFYIVDTRDNKNCGMKRG